MSVITKRKEGKEERGKEGTREERERERGEKTYCFHQRRTVGRCPQSP